jgi:hypothetical protein
VLCLETQQHFIDVYSNLQAMGGKKLLVDGMSLVYSQEASANVAGDATKRCIIARSSV